MLGLTAVTLGPGGAMNVNLSLALVALVPPGVVTVTSTVVPAVPVSLFIVMSSSLRTPNVDDIVPNFTAVAPEKPVPVMYTVVPCRPELGLTAVTTGIGAAV